MKKLFPLLLLVLLFSCDLDTKITEDPFEYPEKTQDSTATGTLIEYEPIKNKE